MASKWVWLLLACCHAPKKLPPAPKTTSAEIYLGNLDGQIQELERLTRESPELDQNVLSLAAAHHLRGRIRGDLDELQSSVDLLATRTDAAGLLLRAEHEQSLHRFEQARADVARARQLGADPARCASLEGELAWNAGRYDDAIPMIRREARDDSASWIRLAQLEHDLGHEPEADAAFDRARSRVHDPSPLGVAHLDAQRGIVLQQQRRFDEALPYLREAVERLPQYVAAQDHLAETLHERGDDAEATRIYEHLVSVSRDPELTHALATEYALAGRGDEARALDEQARATYLQLLDRYPEAMYWHAAEFFLDTGDAGRAVELLRKNVLLRPTSESYVALARAELATKNLQAARDALAHAEAMPVKSRLLTETAERLR